MARKPAAKNPPTPSELDNTPPMDTSDVPSEARFQALVTAVEILASASNVGDRASIDALIASARRRS